MNVLRLLCVLCSLFMLTAVLPAAWAAPAAKSVTVPAEPSDPADGRQAMDVLGQLLAAWTEGKPRQAETFIEPQMTGYARLADALRETAQTQKQLRINLSDTRTLVSKDVVIIRTRWEKRFLALPALAAQARTGNATFVMHRDEGAWRLSALSGDNLFAAD